MSKKLITKAGADQNSAFSLFQQLQAQAKGKLTEVSLELSYSLSFDEWCEVGRTLARVEHTANWWLGDWWSHGKHYYGERKDLTNQEDWPGPSFQTCMSVAVVSRAFPTCRRRKVLSFSHHKEVASLEPKVADELLAWCEEPLKTGGTKPRSVADLRTRIIEVETGIIADRVKLAETSHSRHRPKKYHQPEREDGYSSLRVLTGEQFTAAQVVAGAEDATKALCSLRSRLENTVTIINAVDVSKMPAEAWNQHGRGCRQALREIERFLDTIEPPR
jgi:hypothetical protein